MTFYHLLFRIFLISKKSGFVNSHTGNKYNFSSHLKSNHQFLLANMYLVITCGWCILTVHCHIQINLMAVCSSEKNYIGTSYVAHAGTHLKLVNSFDMEWPFNHNSSKHQYVRVYREKRKRQPVGGISSSMCCRKSGCRRSCECRRQTVRLAACTRLEVTVPVPWRQYGVPLLCHSNLFAAAAAAHILSNSN